MIQASELRIGNLVFRKSDMFMSEIHSIWPSSVKLWCNPLCLFKDYEIEPVPLSEEILLKVGFVQQPSPFSGVFINGSIPIVPDYNDSHQIVGYELVFHTNAGTNRVKVKYLHQLQNLIFSLTGQELNTSGLTKND